MVEVDQDVTKSSMFRIVAVFPCVRGLQMRKALSDNEGLRISERNLKERNNVTCTPPHQKLQDQRQDVGHNSNANGQATLPKRTRQIASVGTC